MPGALRRLYSDSECSEGSWGGCETPQCVTPPKRRRLNILHSGSSASGGKSKPEVQVKVAAASQPPRGWSAEEFARSTPSRVDGVSERDERSQRMLISERARDVVRGLLGHGTSVSPAIELTRLRAQGLACYYVQLFYMSVSLTREDCDVVALAVLPAAPPGLCSLCCSGGFSHNNNNSSNSCDDGFKNNNKNNKKNKNSNKKNKNSNNNKKNSNNNKKNSNNKKNNSNNKKKNNCDDGFNDWENPWSAEKKHWSGALSNIEALVQS
ncbi:unnamed protein product [Polarella glacialis]|uniref:Uncharacterized protein n=1 Tax=Polarella glacialis TaxID=89957 RepID=A0A813EYY7_POLGL|nr:unnamed protein product [Polarella glacialis]